MMVQGALPWEGMHLKKTIQREKELRLGHDLAINLPPVFGDFLDHSRGLEYEEEPDYSRWRAAFRTIASESILMVFVAIPAHTFFKRSTTFVPESETESEDEENVGGDSDDDWVPVCSGSAPYGVSASNVFGDEDDDS